MARKSALGDGEDIPTQVGTPQDVAKAPLADLAEEVLFVPREEHRTLKARFLARTSDNPAIDLPTIDLATGCRILGNNKLAKYWSLPGFRDWFRNSSEQREQLEELFDLALTAARDILLSTEPKVQGARVQMIKTVAELAAKYPKKQAENPMLSAVNSMDKASLQMLLEKGGVTYKLDASKGQSEQAITVESIDTPEK
jgi:hypothetical protein